MISNWFRIKSTRWYDQDCCFHPHKWDITKTRLWRSPSKIQHPSYICLFCIFFLAGECGFFKRKCREIRILVSRYASTEFVHDDVIKWNHFPRYWPFVRGIPRSPVNSLHKGQWRRALMFSLICAWINGWVNNREAGDLRRNRAHYDVIVSITREDRLVVVHRVQHIPWNIPQFCRGLFC